MDAFFAAVEQRDNPELRGKPIAVGNEGRRGVVSTASYEARRYGVHSAMSSVVALRRCPQLIYQLRVHAASADGLNAPIHGDALYGTPGSRLCLHANCIIFRHPDTGEWMTLESTPEF